MVVCRGRCGLRSAWPHHTDISRPSSTIGLSISIPAVSMAAHATLARLELLSPLFVHNGLLHWPTLAVAQERCTAIRSRLDVLRVWVGNKEAHCHVGIVASCRQRLQLVICYTRCQRDESGVQGRELNLCYK